MNIRGVELLKATGLPLPRNSVFFVDPEEVDLEALFAGAKRGVTIMVYDHAERITQVPHFEKGIMRLEVEKDNFIRISEIMKDQLQDTGSVLGENIVFQAHLTYRQPDIAFTGRAAVSRNVFKLDVSDVLRKAHEELTPRYSFFCPFFGRPIRSEAQIRGTLDFPDYLLAKVLRNIAKLPDGSNVDFQVYSDTGELFYHDLFIE